MAGTAAVDAAVLLWLEGAGKWRRDEGALEGVGRWGDGWRKTCRLGEHVNEFKDKDAGECPSQVGDASGYMLDIMCMVDCRMRNGESR